MPNRTYSAILADLDGTMNRGNTLILGADEVYRNLTDRSVKWIFLSNNATAMPSGLAARIRGLGLDVDDEQVLNSGAALIMRLKNGSGFRRVFVVGEAALVDAVARAGPDVAEDAEGVDLVVAAMDKGFTYHKLATAQKAICNGAVFWATNLDPSFPDSDGPKPGAGSLIAAIATASGHPPDKVFGKPSPELAESALNLLGLPPESCLVVGDRMETDILLAHNAGMDSVLVLTGATSRGDLSRFPYRPTYVFESIADIGTLFR
ncbi:MAG: HAD-IIA family hydrolase [Pseudomonadota bacterium]